MSDTPITEYQYYELLSENTALRSLLSECEPYMKERETISQCIERNRNDVQIAMRAWARDLIRLEDEVSALRAELAQVKGKNERLKKYGLSKLAEEFDAAALDAEFVGEDHPLVRLCDDNDKLRARVKKLERLLRRTVHTGCLCPECKDARAALGSEK